MKKKIIQLPKEYLSYSQIQLWKNDKKRYIELYFNNRNELRISNAGMEYGKIVADALEHNKNTDDLLTDAAMLLLTKYDTRDKEIRATIKAKEGSFDVIGRPDTLDSATMAFREYKTGKGAWTQNKAQKHPQMVFYAMLIYLTTKKVPPYIHLDWIQTEDTPEGVKPTGRVETFEVSITLTDILKCIADTIKYAKQIELAWVAHVPPPEEIF